MWKCHKCGKPVYFAERKQSLGRDWHPECLRCEECGKRLHPGQHVEHKGVPYCHVPCYGALFGPQLFGHGTKVESHKSFGIQQKDGPKTNGPVLPRSHLDSKLKVYNQFFEGRSGEIRSREVNGRLILEGPLRIHWGVQGVIHLKENDDQRTVVTIRKRNSCRVSPEFDSDDDTQEIMTDSSFNDTSMSSDFTSSTDTLSPDDKADTGIDSGTDTSTSETIDGGGGPSILPRSLTLPNKLDIKSVEWDELDELLQVERKVDESEKLYQTMPSALPSQASVDSTSSTYSASSSSTEKNDTTEITSKPEEGPASVGTTIESDEEIYYTMPTSSKMSSSTISELPSLSEKIDSSSMYTDIPQATDSTSNLKNKQNGDLSTDETWSDMCNQLNRSMSGPDCLERMRGARSPEFDTSSITSYDMSSSQDNDQEVVMRKKAAKTGASAIKRRPGKRLSRTKIKRRCSINGHFYDRETSFFTPPHGSQMSVWVTSLVNTMEVINLMLEKYKVDSDGCNFALFVVRDNGEQRRLKDDDYPLLCRVLLGPHEDVVRLFLMDSHNTPEVSNEVAQFLNFTLAECRGILNQYHTQEDREIDRIRDKYAEMKRRIKNRMEELKVRL